MMTYEQSLDLPISELTKKLIEIKQADEQAKAATANRQIELNNFRVASVGEFERSKVLAYSQVSEYVKNCMLYALDAIPVEQIEVYKANTINAYTTANFAIVIPTNIDAEKQAILTDVWSKWDAQHFVNTFQEQFNTEFSDFAIKSQQKEEAKKQAIATAVENTTQAEETSKNAVAGAVLDTMSVPVVLAATKKLKQTFELDMADTTDTLRAIVKAFFALFPQAILKVKVKSYLKLSVAQMGKALADLKSEDNNLQIEGITFKPVAKL